MAKVVGSFGGHQLMNVEVWSNIDAAIRVLPTFFEAVAETMPVVVKEAADVALLQAFKDTKFPRFTGALQKSMKWKQVTKLGKVGGTRFSTFTITNVESYYDEITKKRGIPALREVTGKLQRWANFYNTFAARAGYTGTGGGPSSRSSIRNLETQFADHQQKRFGPRTRWSVEEDLMAFDEKVLGKKRKKTPADNIMGRKGSNKNFMWVGRGKHPKSTYFKGTWKTKGPGNFEERLAYILERFIKEAIMEGRVFSSTNVFGKRGTIADVGGTVDKHGTQLGLEGLIYSFERNWEQSVGNAIVKISGAVPFKPIFLRQLFSAG